MIPETITIPTAAIVRFTVILCPSLFIGWFVGCFTVFYIIHQTGYRVVWKSLGSRNWPVMEKIENVSKPKVTKVASD